MLVESKVIVQFTVPKHEGKCNCRLCRTANRALGQGYWEMWNKLNSAQTCK